MDPVLVLMITAGTVTAGAGLWVLRARHAEPAPRAWYETPAEDEDATALPLVGRVTPHTRMVIGLALLLLGYHLAVWRLPPSSGAIRVPPERWYVLTLVLAASVGASFALDAASNRRQRRTDHDPDGGSGS